MPASKDIPLRFGIVTDIHYDPETEIGNQTEAGLERCMEQWRQEGAEFVIQLGDIINREGPEAEADLIAVRDMLARFPGPVHHVAGNHCLAVPSGRYKEIMGLDCLYYTFNAHGIRFIVLDGMDVSVNAEPENEADRNLLRYYREERQEPFYCGAVGSRQLEWLAGELETSLMTLEPVIVLSHLPLLEETSDHKHGLLWNHEEVTELLCRYPNIRACFSGHYHPGAYAFMCGIHFAVVPGFATRAEHPEFMAGTVAIADGRMHISSTDGARLHDLEFVF